ncbi:MAG: cytochrome c oxidase subunit 3 [Acidimicrobiales bacterium]
MAVAEVAGGVEGAGRGPSALGVGTIVWLASELMFFAGLFAAYFTLRSINDAWPPSDVDLELLRPAIFTGVLVASSFTMHGAVAAGRRRDRPSAIRWLALTGLLGGAFLANQGIEYAEASFSISSHAYGSMFFLMTGFHGLHVLGGLFFMLAVAGVIAGRSRAPAEATVDMCAYYWHFVDVVWVGMFATIFLIR